MSRVSVGLLRVRLEHQGETLALPLFPNNLFMKFAASPYWVLLSLIGLLFSTGLFAQTSEEKKKLKFSCLYWEGAPPETLYYRQGKEFQPIEFKEGVRSEDFALKATPVFELYREVQEPKEDEPPYQLLSKATIPPNSKQVLFLVIPFETKKEVQYKVVAMDDSLTSFPRGTFRFANFTSELLMVKFAGKIKKIPSKDMVVMSCQAGKNGGFEPFILGDSKGKQIFGTRLFGQPSGRELIFISPPSKNGGTPRVKFISQLLAPPVPEGNQ